MNNNLTIHRDKLFAFTGWLRNGFSLLRHNWLMSLLIMFVTGIAGVALLVLGVLLNRVIHSSVLIFVLAALISAILALAIALLVAVTERNEQPNKFKYLISIVWHAHSFRIVLIYLLLLLGVSLGGSLLYFQFPQHEFAISIIIELLLFVLQILSFIVLPLNILTKGTIKPFHVFAYGLQILAKNILSMVILIAVLFLALSIATSIASLLTQFIDKFALIIYVFEVWVLITVLVFSCLTAVKHSITPIDN